MNTNKVNNLNSEFRKKAPINSYQTPYETPYTMPYANGVMPPAPSVISSDSYSYLSESASPDYYLITINSGREPYASEFLVTKYGEVQTRLGTSMGTRRN
jgi:hypothetical protein